MVKEEYCREIGWSRGIFPLEQYLSMQMILRKSGSTRGIAGVLWAALFLLALNLAMVDLEAQGTASTTAAQLIPRTMEDRARVEQASRRTVLNVQVTDSSNKPVTGLRPEDFTLLDNGKPQTIGAIREIDGQASSADARVVLVMDGINDGGSAIGHVKKDLAKFLSQSHEPLAYPLSLAFVSNGGESESKPSTDRAVIAGQLAEFARRSHSSDCEPAQSIEGSRIQSSSGQPISSQGSRMQERGSCLDEQFARSVSALRVLIVEQQDVRGRAIVIWAGPGWPLVTTYGAGPGPEAHRGNYRDMLAELMGNLHESQVTLDAISWGDFEHPREIRKPVISVDAKVPSTPDEMAEEEIALPVLARVSGGQAFAKEKSFAESFASFLGDLDRFYRLSFDSLAGAAPDESHSIEVKVDRPGVTVRTSTEYFAQP